MTRALVLALMGATLALAACDDDDVTGPGDGPRLGILEWEGLEPVEPMLEVPDTVQAATAFEVVVRTWAPDGCWAPADPVITYGNVGLVVLIQPYDQPIEGDACGDEPIRVSRTVLLAFPESGHARIKLSGRRVEMDEDPGTADGRVAIETSLRVIPQEEPSGG